MAYDDIWRILASANLSVNTSGGASASTALFGPETYAVQVCFVNSTTASTTGVRIAVGNATEAPAAVASSMLLPPNWPFIIKVTPGQRVAALSNDAAALTLNVVELTK